MHRASSLDDTAILWLLFIMLMFRIARGTNIWSNYTLPGYREVFPHLTLMIELISLSKKNDMRLQQVVFIMQIRFCLDWAAWPRVTKTKGNQNFNVVIHELIQLNHWSWRHIMNCSSHSDNSWLNQLIKPTEYYLRLKFLSSCVTHWVSGSSTSCTLRIFKFIAYFSPVSY